jgi:hypothetical protein
LDPKKTKRQQWKRGAVVRIRLGEYQFAYGQMLNEPEYAFFSVRDSGASEATLVAGKAVIFRLWVMRHAHGSGRWEKIGNASLQIQLESPVFRFNQDPLDPAKIQLGEGGLSGRLVSPEECDRFERAAVWDASQVEDRLRDHFEGRPNRWVESMRPKRGSRPTNR